MELNETASVFHHNETNYWVVAKAIWFYKLVDWWIDKHLCLSVVLNFKNIPEI